MAALRFSISTSPESPQAPRANRQHHGCLRTRGARPPSTTIVVPINSPSSNWRSTSPHSSPPVPGAPSRSIATSCNSFGNLFLSEIGGGLRSSSPQCRTLRDILTVAEIALREVSANAPMSGDGARSEEATARLAGGASDSLFFRLPLGRKLPPCE